ncbi:DUF2905 domain-containing protein [Persicobacter diffluens]|uniref:DUF2905 domain-containing protein n=1 Tax=Persicobacter diffluens TaxID=981 RepID=A0AAN5AI70_9BACT|nr:hypothetical protein PEDI_06520 [Persicobacter diffluens]
MENSLAKILMMAGAGLFLIGLIIYLLQGKGSWFGHLPGDIRVEKENFQLYIPWVSMLLVSVILSVLFHLFKRFF